eukprot:GEZU01009157.1.p1 GENE.GEZU01009157.1~~GEZU01009157.1.p1  ORF type:complete len:103 (-),score=17.21 GEZU01009157.1:27-335(-)
MNITSDEIAFIVERLNEVLRLDLTLVGLDEKSGQDLLQILNDVLSTLDSSQNVELRDEGAEMTASRILDFVGRILNMKQLSVLLVCTHNQARRCCNQSGCRR